MYPNKPNLEQDLWYSSLSLSWTLVARKLRIWLLNSKQPTCHIHIGPVNAKQGYGCPLKTEQNSDKISHMQQDRIKPSWLLDRKKWGKEKYSQYSQPTTPWNQTQNIGRREKSESPSEHSHWFAQKQMNGMEADPTWHSAHPAPIQACAPPYWCHLNTWGSLHCAKWALVAKNPKVRSFGRSAWSKLALCFRFPVRTE